MPRQFTRFLRLFCFLCLIPAIALAGDEWKPLSPGELALKEPVVEKDADAEIILWEVRADDSSEDLILKHYLRVKVFNEKGREKFSKVEIEYQNGTQIKDVAARVTKADGTVVELKKEDVFERTIIKVGGVKLKQKSFAAPGLEPGAILEYRYREVVENGRADLDLVLQREVPIQTVAYYVRPSSGLGGMYSQAFNVPQSFKFEKDKNSFYKASLTNVPALRSEPYMLPNNDVRAWCSIFYVPIDKLTADKYWSHALYVVKELLEDGLKPNDDVKKMAAEVTAKATTPEEKLALLYEFCQTQIKNITFDYTLTDDDRKKLKSNNKPSDTLKRRQGNTLNINQLFFAMAKASGFETRMLMAADRSKKLFDSGMIGPFLRVSAAGVKVEDRWRFFSPGQPYLPLGMLPWYEEGQEAMLLGNKDYFEIKTPISAPARSVAKRTGKFRLLEDGALEGEVRIEYTGHLGFERKLANDEDSAAKREETLRDEIKARLSTAELSDVKVENVTEPGSKPFTYAFKVKVPNYASKTGKRMFLQPNFFEANSQPAFTSGERKYKIYVNYPWAEEDELTIELPPGYALDSPDAPEPLVVEGVSANQVAMTINGQTLNYKRRFFFGNNSTLLIFNANQYTAVKQFFEGINKVDTHALTLKAK